VIQGTQGGPIGHGYSENFFTNNAVWGLGLGVPVAQSSIPQILSIHLNPAGVPDDEHDAAWKALILDENQITQLQTAPTLSTF